MQRSAGILLPISSLPSPYGIGCFSQEAYDFVDWLKEAGQTYWQILPLGVTSNHTFKSTKRMDMTGWKTV